MDTTTIQGLDNTEAVPGVSEFLDQTSGLFVALTWLSILFTIVLLVVFVLNAVRRWQVQSAILAMQKDLRDMNERDKRRGFPTQPPHVIAADDSKSTS